MIFYLDN